MNGYECIFITNSDLDQEAQNAALERVRGIITKLEGTIEHEVLWGRRKLAYLVKKQQYGVYHVWYIKGPGPMLAELNQQFVYMDEVIKFQTITVNNLEEEYNHFLALTKGPVREEPAEGEAPAAAPAVATEASETETVPAN